MKVRDLIKKLEACDQASEIEVSVGSFYKAYPVAYLKDIQVFNKQNGTNTRIYVSLPEELKVSQLKKLR